MSACQGVASQGTEGNGKAGPWGRLNSHASGRRSGDQLCVYVVQSAAAEATVTLSSQRGWASPANPAHPVVPQQGIVRPKPPLLTKAIGHQDDSPIMAKVLR